MTKVRLQLGPKLPRLGLALLAFVTVLGSQSGRIFEARAQSASHLYIMFLPGLCAYPGSDRYCGSRIAATSRGAATFGTLTSAMRSAHVQYTPLYYGYNPAHPAYYSVNDTHQSVSVSVTALEDQLRQVMRRDPHATFDLVGHSLGGVVAASWAVTNGREYGYRPSQGLLGRVRNIVTFDSPVRGINALYSSGFVSSIFGGAVLYSLLPNSETIKEITYFPASWWRSTGRLRDVANRADRIVPANEAVLGDSRVVNDTVCSRDILFFRSCHGAVLADRSLNQWVACHWITDAYQCAPRPTPTPTIAPTLTPTPTPTATLPPPPTATATTVVQPETGTPTSISGNTAQ